MHITSLRGVTFLKFRQNIYHTSNRPEKAIKRLGKSRIFKKLNLFKA